MICVYTHDATDREDVMRVRERLREIGFTKKLSYKTDQATAAGVYSNNSEKPISTYYEWNSENDVAPKDVVEPQHITFDSMRPLVGSSNVT